MINATSAAKPLEAPSVKGGEATRLIALLESGDLTAADNLTMEIATETATWFDVPDSKYTAEQFAGKVKQFWLGTHKRILDLDQAGTEEIERIWTAAAARKKEALAKKAEREEPLPAPMTYRELKALMAKPEADQPKSARPIAADKIEPSSGPPAKAEAVPAEPKAGVATLARPKSLCAPGLLGEIADFALGAMMYPSEKYAVAMAIGVNGTLISRRIAGPSGPRGTGTHTYLGIVGPTGIGKETLRTIGKLLMTTAGAAALIGPGRFKSGAGIVKYLQKTPAAECFFDELGAYLARLSDPKASIYEREATEILRELWGLSWGRYDSPQGARDDSELVLCPALSLFGMTTPKELYRACKSRDISNGFLNRWTFVEEKTAPPYQRVNEEALTVPKSLREGLAKLYQPVSVLDQNGKPAFRMTWGPGAEEVWNAIREQIERETDERRRELFWRSPEKTVRVATVAAASYFATTVSREHMEWAREWILSGDNTLYAGVTEFMEEEKLEFFALCRKIIRRFRLEGGSMTLREIKRSFQNNLRYKKDLASALEQLTETEQLIERKDKDTGGRPSIWYSLPEEEG